MGPVRILIFEETVKKNIFKNRTQCALFSSLIPSLTLFFFLFLLPSLSSVYLSSLCGVTSCTTRKGTKRKAKQQEAKQEAAEENSTKAQPRGKTSKPRNLVSEELLLLFNTFISIRTVSLTETKRTVLFVWKTIFVQLFGVCGRKHSQLELRFVCLFN